MRHKYLAAVLRQDVGYFDTTATSGEGCSWAVTLGGVLCHQVRRQQTRRQRPWAGACCVSLSVTNLPSCAMCRPALPAGRLLQGLNEDCQTIQLGIGEKVGLLQQALIADAHQHVRGRMPHAVAPHLIF